VTPPKTPSVHKLPLGFICFAFLGVLLGLRCQYLPGRGISQHLACARHTTKTLDERASRDRLATNIQVPMYPCRGSSYLPEPVLVYRLAFSLLGGLAHLRWLALPEVFVVSCDSTATLLRW
jgi:hypothetical protein